MTGKAFTLAHRLMNNALLINVFFILVAGKTEFGGFFLKHALISADMGIMTDYALALGYRLMNSFFLKG